MWVGSRLKPLTWEPGTHNNLSDTQNYDSEISTPVRPPRSWLPRTNWSIGAKLESSGRHKETYVCVPPNVKSIYAALMMYSRTQGSITNLTKHFPPHTQWVVGSNTSAITLIHFSVFQVRSKIARGACDQPKAGCMGPVVSYNLIPIGHFHLTRSCHWIMLESLTPADSWLSTNTGTH